MTENLQHQDQPKNKKNLTPEEAKELSSIIVGKFQSLKNARSQKEQKWQECIKAFLSQHEHNQNDERKWRSKIYVPLSYEAATNIYSNIKRMLFPTDSSFFTVEGRTESASSSANTIKSYLLYQLDEMNFITKFGAFLKQMVIIGNTAAAIYWKKVKRKGKEKTSIPIFDENGLQVNTEEVEIEVDKVIYDAPEFETINMLDIVFDTSSTNWEEGMTIHRTYRPLEQILNNQVYKNTDGLKAISEIEDNQFKADCSKALEMNDPLKDQKGLVKLYSAYGDFKVGNDIYYDYIAVIANDENLIRFEPNPYPSKPFIFSTYESIPNELYGIGAIEPGLGIQYLVNTFSNQKSDVMSLIINGMWAYVDDGIIDPEEIVAKPGALIAMKDPNNIRPLHPDTSVMLSYNEISQLKAEFQEVTGATKYFTGGPNIDFKKTATEVSTLKEAGIVRFSEVIQNIEENALKRIIKLVFVYNTIFNSSLKQIVSALPGLENIDKDMLINDLNFRVIGANSSISRDIRVNKLLEFIKMVGSSQALASQIDMIELIKALYRELGFKNEANIFIR